MLIVTVRTDKPESELGLYEDTRQIAYVSWPAHRQLAETIHRKIADLLAEHHKQWSDIKAVVAYKGPGSFTGLRIGLSVVNALAASENVPAIGTTGENWIQEGIERACQGSASRVVLPEYGAPVHITAPKK